MTPYRGLPLEPIELDCLRLLGDGSTHREIPNLLGIGRTTMYRALASAREKLKASTDEHAVHLATLYGLI